MITAASDAMPLPRIGGDWRGHFSERPIMLDRVISFWAEHGIDPASADPQPEQDEQDDDDLLDDASARSLGEYAREIVQRLLQGLSHE